MSDDPGFLSRWSRRKREAKREIDPPVPQSPPEGAELPDPGAATAEASQAPETITEEEIAALPSIEELTRETDITQFLRKGVPPALRNAALRRMWSADPAIRDFVSEAREYAYDWNVPGSVPGTGPLLATDDVPAMLQRLFGNIEDPPAEGAQAVETPMSAQPALSSHEPTDAPPVGPTQGASRPEPESPQSAPRPSPTPQPETSEPEQDPPARSNGTPRRRHGGALPS